MSMMSFRERVIDVVTKIPLGSVMTYGDVATGAGSPGAARAVGSIMAQNADTTVPCHRVIRSDGTMGAYNGLRGKDKETVLKNEGYNA